MKIWYDGLKTATLTSEIENYVRYRAENLQCSWRNNSDAGAPEMKTGRVDRHQSGQPAGRVTGRVEILRPAGQTG